MSSQKKITIYEMFIQLKMRFPTFSIDKLTDKLNNNDLGIMLMTKKAKEERGDTYVSDISSALKTPMSAVSRSLKLLEDKNLIERFTDKQDRRNIHVLLTKDGETELEKVSQKIWDLTSRIFGHLTKEEQEMYRVLNEKLQIATDEEVEKFLK